MSRQHPLIGISCRPDISGVYPGRIINAQNKSYTDAILQAGGIPILIPVEVNGYQLMEIFNRVDGILFSGGGDVDPAFYNEKPAVDNLSDIQKERDIHELELMRLTMEQQKPFFAICRGIQVMNVAVGGTLWQDVTKQYHNPIRHDFYYTDNRFPRYFIAHEVNVEKSSLLGQILDSERIPVNSLHHQGIKEISPVLRIAACADDGLVEALEVIDHPFGLGVQWHPEELVDEHSSARKIFEAFIEATRNHQPAQPS
ncbi:MAG: gamma-glutamyl-gamma-aminobutyrate hydrolase family protein [Anaerolineaceae bacterium]|nr:gamma-glutamyl-gamma-aminobutyrate hydrolase family protein [Anaerolineaceae bacterium]